jgi:hypothetical protein
MWWTILFWAAVIMLADAGVALLGLHYWQRMMPDINVYRIARIEAVAAILMLVIYFVHRFNG